MKPTCPEGDFGFFFAEREGDVLKIQFRKNLLEHLSDLSKRDIKVILVHSDFSESGCEAYARFFLKKSGSTEHLDFHRLCNISSQLIQSILSL